MLFRRRRMIHTQTRKTMKSTKQTPPPAAAMGKMGKALAVDGVVTVEEVVGDKVGVDVVVVVGDKVGDKVGENVGESGMSSGTDGAR